MLTVEQVKLHCRVDESSAIEDEWFSARIKSAEQHVQKYTRRTLYESQDSPGYAEDRDSLLYGEDIEIAMLMLIAHWYSNREATTAGVSSPLDFAVDSMLQPYRIYGV